MRRTQYTLSAKDVTRGAVQWLTAALQWSTHPAVETPVLVRLLVRAAAAMRSLSAIVAEARQAPCFETVRKALRAQLPTKPLDFLPASTRALQTRLPKALRRRPRRMAIDLHLRPFY